MNKKVKKFFYYIIIFLVLIVSLTGCSKNSDSENLKSKVTEEISYLDSKLIAMLNQANGISLENYIVTAEEVSEESNSSQDKSSSSNKSQEDSKDSSQDSDENSEQTTNSSTSGSSSGQNNTNNVKYKMESNEILLQNRDPDWASIKSEIEKLYSSWSTIVLDLYKENVNNQDILNFKADLDVATQSIKNEDKVQTLNNLAKLYSYIPKYVSSISDDTKANSVYKTKESILNAYASIEQDNFTEVQKQLLEAEQSFLPILNNISSNQNNQTEINKIYVLIKEMQNSLDKKDKEIFYINYKNLIQQLNNID